MNALNRRRSRLFLILLLLPLVCPAAAARLAVSFADVAAFTDFSLHQQTPEATLVVFERQLERYWNDVLARQFADGHTLELHFTDIDMAGRIEPLRDTRIPDARYLGSRYPPRLKFSYRLLDEAGEAVSSGEENYLDPRFLHPGSGAIMGLHQYAFTFEFEMLRKWAVRTFPRKKR